MRLDKSEPLGPENSEPAWLIDMGVLVTACLRRWSESSRCRPNEVRKYHQGWIDLWRCCQLFLEGYAGAVLRSHRIRDRSLADEIACSVFASLATELSRHVRKSNTKEPCACPADPPSSILRSRLRKYKKEQRRLDCPMEWDSLEKFLKHLVRNEVRTVVRRGQHQWRREQAPPQALAPEPPVTEQQFHEAVDVIQARLREGALLDTFLSEVLNETVEDPPKRDVAGRKRLSRLRRRATKLLEGAGFL